MMRVSDSGRRKLIAGNIGVAFLLGAVSGIAWDAYSRRAGAGRQLIDWDRAYRVASALSGSARRPLNASQAAQRTAEYKEIIERVAPGMLEYLGTGSSATFQFSAIARAVDRNAWIEANIATFGNVFRPVETLLTNRFGSRFSQPFNQQASSLFLGVMLGYLSHRVLGQYDASLLGAEPLPSGKLFFVEPNLQAAQEELGAPPDQFATWIVFHELTHAWQFEAHPWLREFMNEQVTKLITSTTGKLVQIDAPELLRLAMRGELNLRRPSKLMAAVVTPDQLGLFQQLQALMSLVEGFSDHVMDALGPRMLPDYYEIARKFENRRRRKGPGEKLFQQLTGLEMKMEQYRAGEAFVDAVARQRGIAFVNLAWEGPERLPTLKEIYEPSSWISRIDGMTA